MLRIGSIGSGRRGEIVLLAHQPEEGVELAMICDTNPAVIEKYHEKLGDTLPATNDWRNVIANKELDAIFITTPDYLHEEQTVAALEAGKIVYLEKPMAITIEGCDRILRATRDSQLYVGHNMRFFPVMQKMKELITQGTIGEVQAIWCRHFISYGGDAYFKDWHSEQKYTTGLLLQKAAHDIDIIHWLANSYTQRTVGMGKLSVYDKVSDRRDGTETGDPSFTPENWPPRKQTKLSPIIDVEDHNMMLMQLANGVQASYEQCHYSPDSQRNYTIIGTEGRIENIGDYSSNDYIASVRIWKTRCENKIDQFEEIPIPVLAGGHGGADHQIIADFIRFLKTGKNEGATPIDARMSVAAGVQATRSLREGNIPLDIPPYVPAL